jgi:hypothetical protein
MQDVELIRLDDVLRPVKQDDREKYLQRALVPTRVQVFEKAG